MKNSGFETGIISPPWGIWVGANSMVSIDTNVVYNGEYAVNLTGNKAYLYQSVNLDPNTSYNISATLKTESGNAVYFGVSNIWDTTGVNLIFNETVFQTKSLSFTTGNNPNNDPRVYVWKEVGTGGVWVDDFLLIADTTGQIPDEIGGLGTYYVSPTGNDLNDGTSSEQAWKTIDKINRIDFEPGDTILFEGGKTFIGGIRFNQTDSGTINNKIHIGSYGSGRALIDAGTGTGFTAFDCNNIVFNNLNFKGDGRITGNTGNGMSFSFCSDIQVDNVEIYGFQHSGLVVKNSGNNYRFTNIFAHDNGYAGIYISGTDKESLSDIYIGHCIADNNPGDPTETDNHSGNGILAFMASNILIEYCKASNNGWDMPRTGNGPGGIWVAEVDRAIIQYCISHDNKTSVGGQDGLGFDLDGGTTNSVIQYCLSYNNHGAGYGIFQYNGASDWKNNTIRYCISENDGNVSANSNILLWNGSGNSTKFHGLQFHNNVIYNNTKAALDFYDHKNSGFSLRNNIFVSKTQNVFNRISGENFQGNCWYTLNDGAGVDSLNFINWVQNSNQEKLNGEIVGFYSNPKLVNPGNSNITDPTQLSSVNDYKVADGSKVIDSGLDLKSLFNVDPGPHDYFGNLLIEGQLFDMGIYKYLDKKRVDLSSGWNIFSLNVMPGDSNLMNILQPLINEGKLKKVMDESGKVIEDWGTFGGWQNTIGDIKSTEGYKINVSSPAIINVSGKKSVLPFEIPLHAGWNIVSWPLLISKNAMDVFKTLIDGGKLKKVMDESGKVIEDWGSFGGWQNTIGNLKPGEGYKVNVNTSCTLIINETGTKSEEIQPESNTSSHFIPAYKGNGIDHMNINLIKLAESGIMEGDEIGIFDRGICVGSARIPNLKFQISNLNSISITVSAIDGIEGKNGYTEGNPISLKLFRNGKEYPLTIQPLNQTKTVFEKGSSLFAQVYLATSLNRLTTSETAKINCYPNPFSDEVTIEINLSAGAQVEVEVLNQLGQRVNFITEERVLNSGTHRLKWNGKNSATQQVSAGIYFIRVVIDGKINFKKVVYSKIEG